MRVLGIHALYVVWVAIHFRNDIARALGIHTRYVCWVATHFCHDVVRVLGIHTRYNLNEFKYLSVIV